MVLIATFYCISISVLYCNSGNAIATTIIFFYFFRPSILKFHALKTDIYFEHPDFGQQTSLEVTSTNYSDPTQQLGLTSRYKNAPLFPQDNVLTFLPTAPWPTNKIKIVPKEDLTTTLLATVTSTDKQNLSSISDVDRGKRIMPKNEVYRVFRHYPLTQFPALFVDSKVGISRSASETDDWLFFLTTFGSFQERFINYFLKRYMKA